MNSSPFNPEFFIAIVYLCAVNMSLFVVIRRNVGSARTGLYEPFFFLFAVQWTKGPDSTNVFIMGHGKSYYFWEAGGGYIDASYQSGKRFVRAGPEQLALIKDKPTFGGNSCTYNPIPNNASTVCTEMLHYQNILSFLSVFKGASVLQANFVHFQKTKNNQSPTLFHLHAFINVALLLFVFM